ncbi:tripartite tricarboxylate transporter substrate-binding protein [Streptomyces sp. PT12]|uniref:tripartite tricarboxylate transporter substrate-binding protein n=1 Tax=Streptomyces sp. PT12 TaxID=1510197 RepID=UPI00215C8FBF|nr:tripartite tricarboxylate transporter substrate-binding protein [Streptomyces sp. PT12]
MGLGLLGGARATGAAVSVGDATPLARLIDEPGAVVVAAGSPYPTFGALVDDWRSGALATGIGSHVGGPDHLALMLIAEAVGLAPRALPHERFDGGGDLLAALLGGRVDFVVSGLSEYQHAVDAGELRVLAVTGPQRSPALTPRRSTRWAWTWSSPTGAGSSSLPGSPPRRASG